MKELLIQIEPFQIEFKKKTEKYLSERRINSKLVGLYGCVVIVPFGFCNFHIGANVSKVFFRK